MPNLATVGVNMVANARGFVSGMKIGRKEVGSFARVAESTLKSAGKAVSAARRELTVLKTTVSSVTSSIPGFDKATAKVARGMQHLKTGVISAVKGMVRMAAQAAVLSAALVGVGSIAGGISLGVKLAADLEQSTVAFTTMLGSVENAKQILMEVDAFAASTPFQFPELVDTTKALLAFGFAQSEIIPTMRRIGDVAAGLGIPIAELAEIYGKARTSGTLFAEDINQLTGRGIPIIALLAKQFGIAESEVKKLVSTGAVGFKDLEKAFVTLTDAGGQFAGLMEAQSQTLAGLFSTLKDNVERALRSIGQLLVDELDLKAILQEATQAVQAFAATAIPMLKENMDQLTRAVKIFLSAMQELAPALWLLTKMFLPVDEFSERFSEELQRIKQEAAESAAAAEAEAKRAAEARKARLLQELTVEGYVAKERAALMEYEARVAMEQAEERKKAAEKASEALEGRVADLQHEIEYYGDASRVARLMKMDLEGVSEARREEAIALAQQLDAMDEETKRRERLEQQQKREADRLKSRAEAIFEQTRTPFELAKADAEELVMLFKQGLVDEDTFLRRQQQIREDLKKKAQEVAAIDRGQSLAKAIRKGSAEEISLVNRTNTEGQQRRQIQLQQQALVEAQRQTAATNRVAGVLSEEFGKKPREVIPA